MIYGFTCTRISNDLGCVTFHDFDNPEYPHADVQKIKALLNKYDSNAHIVRSSHTPEFGRNDPLRQPGLTQPEWVAPLIIGALKDGLHAAGFWEVQNKSGADDHRYWFDGNNTVNTSNTFVMMSKTFKLGTDSYKVFDVKGMPYAHAMGAINMYEEHVAVFVAKSDAYGMNLTIQNMAVKDSVKIEVYRGDAVGDGQTVIDLFYVQLKNSKLNFSYTIPEKSVVGFKIVNQSGNDVTSF